MCWILEVKEEKKSFMCYSRYAKKNISGPTGSLFEVLQRMK